MECGPARREPWPVSPPAGTQRYCGSILTPQQSLDSRLPAHLYVSELCDFQEARPSLGQQEEAFLCHGDDSHAAGRLDAGRQLIHALVVVQVVDDLGGQIHILCLGLCLLPEGVEDSEELGVDLLLLAWWWWWQWRGRGRVEKHINRRR